MTSQKTYTTLLVDIDGVIHFWPRSDATVEVEHGLPIGSLRRVAFAKEQLEPAIRGKISAEEWRKNIVIELERVYPDARATDAVKAWSDQTRGRLNDGVLTMLEAYRPKLKQYLITNGTSALDTFLDQLDLRARFDGIVNSATVGHIKPEPEIYQHAMNLAGVSIEETLFVDDNKDNVLAAQEMGIHSHLFEDVMSLSRFLYDALGG